MHLASTSWIARSDARVCLAALLALGLLATAPFARAEIYKCVDLDGHVSYGSTPCETLDLLDRLIHDNGVHDAEPPSGAALPEAAAPPTYAPPSGAPRRPDRAGRDRYDASAES